MKEKVIIIGAGGHAKVIADIIKASGDELVGFLDDDVTKLNQIIFDDRPVIGGLAASANYADCAFIVGIGDNATRARIAQQYPDLKYYIAIHPSAIIGTDITVGAGTVIMPGVIINAGTHIGRHAIINTHATIEHDNEIGDFVHLSPNATLCGTVTVGNGSWICADATVINNISIADDTIIGAGAVVVTSITTPHGIYTGVPAKARQKANE